MDSGFQLQPVGGARRAGKGILRHRAAEDFQIAERGVGFFIAFAFLVVGCFLDAIPAIIIVGTTLQPLAQSVHMHPVQFAIIGIIALAFGLVTPPYGLCLMISCAVAKVPLRFALKDTLIMLVPMLVVLAACIVWPEIVLILPKLISPEYLK